MTQTEKRKFTMADSMILIVGVAVAMAWTRHGYQRMIELYSTSLQSMTWRNHFAYLRYLAITVLIPINMALVACRLCQPRPRFRTLMRQPGALAVIGVSLLAITEVLLFLFCWLITWAVAISGMANSLQIAFQGMWPYDITLIYRLFLIRPIAVIVAWPLLWITGRWKTESTWIDKASRGMGVCWIALYLSTSMYEYTDLLKF